MFSLKDASSVQPPSDSPKYISVDYTTIGNALQGLMENDVTPSCLESEAEEVNFYHHQEHFQSQNVFFPHDKMVST